MLSIVNVVVGGQVKSENTSLPVAVRFSKTRVLKLPNNNFFFQYEKRIGGRRGGLSLSVLVSRSSDLGPSPGQGHCAVFLSKTLYSHSASLHPAPGSSKLTQGWLQF